MFAFEEFSLFLFLGLENFLLFQLVFKVFNCLVEDVCVFLKSHLKQQSFLSHNVLFQIQVIYHFFILGYTNDFIHINIVNNILVNLISFRNPFCTFQKLLNKIHLFFVFLWRILVDLQCFFLALNIGKLTCGIFFYSIYSFHPILSDIKQCFLFLCLFICRQIRRETSRPGTLNQLVIFAEIDI